MYAESINTFIQQNWIDLRESWLDYFVIETNKDINTERLKEDNEYQLI